MRTALVIFMTALKQRLRDRVGLLLTLLTAPAFVGFYWLVFADNSSAWRLAVLDMDNPAPIHSSPTTTLTTLLEKLQDSEGNQPVELQKVDTEEDLQDWLQHADGWIGLVFEPGFSEAWNAGAEANVVLVGDVARPEFHSVASLVERAFRAQWHTRHPQSPVLRFEQRGIGLSAERTGFDAYVPGLIVFAVIMLVFSASMALVRELEWGTFARLRLSPISTFAVVLGTSAVQLLLGAASVVLTLVVAHLTGFQAAGSLWLTAVVCTVACLACVGIGMFVASLARNQTRAFLVASVAMFMMVLFAGIVFPRPEVPLGELGGQSVDLLHLLPTTHLSVALEKILTLGAGAGDIVFELIALSLIALVNFVLGALLLSRVANPSTSGWEGDS